MISCSILGWILLPFGELPPPPTPQAGPQLLKERGLVA